MVFLYSGPARAIPWHEMMHAIKGNAGQDAELTLTMTCDITGKQPSNQHAEQGTPLLKERFSAKADAGPATKKKRTTIGDVAREARVSKMTVSRVANDRTCVTPAVRARVEEVIVRLNYKPNDAARAMVHTRDENRRDLKSVVTMAGYRKTEPDTDDNRKPAAASHR